MKHVVVLNITGAWIDNRPAALNTGQLRLEVESLAEDEHLLNTIDHCRERHEALASANHGLRVANERLALQLLQANARARRWWSR